MIEKRPARRIGVVTTSRADYSHLYWPLRELAAHPGVDLAVFVLGAHLSPDSAAQSKEIERDGFPIQARIECLLNSDTDTGMAKTIGIAILGLADALTAWRPDILLSSPTATRCSPPPPSPSPCASPSPTSKAAKSPRAPSTTTSATPSPSSPPSTSPPRPPPAAASSPWARNLGACITPARPRSTTLPAPHSRPAHARSPPRPPLTPPTILAAWHPVTILKDTNAEADAFFAASPRSPANSLFVYPNADAGSHALIERTRALAATRPYTHIFINLDPITYWSLLGHVDCMIGNSSSGIMEAASFALPVVNVGMRQQGRERAANILDAPAEIQAILAAIHRALAPEFRASLSGMTNPYGNGTAAGTITQVLTTVPLANLLIKQPPQLSGDASVADTSVTEQVDEQPLVLAVELRAEPQPVNPPQALRPFRISIDPPAMTRSRQGTIFGAICFFIGDQAFPASWYTDLVVAFISAWFDAIVKILSRKRNYERVRFYHNPYSVDISSAEVGAVDLEFIWHNAAGDKLLQSFHARLHELTQQTMDVAEQVLAVCEERGWSDPDIRKLAANLKEAPAALVQNPAQELGASGDRSSSLGSKLP
jgi:UDP-N-acetylglucosamine 2-epimerase